MLPLIFADNANPQFLKYIIFIFTKNLELCHF